MLQLRVLRTPRSRSVRCHGMGSFKVSIPHTSEHRFNSVQEFHIIGPSSLPQAVATPALACSISPKHEMDVSEGEHVHASAWCLPRVIVAVPAVGENADSFLANRCMKPAGHLIGGHRRAARSRRGRPSRTGSRASRRQTGARLLPVQPESVQPMPYDPSRVRMKIQDALRVSRGCVSIGIGREAKTVAAKSEFSHCTSLYISGNGSDSEDH